MRNLSPSLLTFITSRPRQAARMDFYEFELTNGVTLRYCTHPRQVSLIPPPPAGGRSEVTVTLLGSAAEVFGSPFVTKYADFTIATVPGITIVALATNPGAALGHISPPVVTDPTGQVTWSQRTQVLGTTGNLALFVYEAATTGAIVGIRFGDPLIPADFLGIVGRMSITVLGFSKSGGASYDTNSSMPAGSFTAGAGLDGLTGLSTDSTYPMLMAFNVQPQSPNLTEVPAAGWATPVQGISNYAPGGANPGTSHSITCTWKASTQLSSSNVNVYSTGTDENILVIDAIANNSAPVIPDPVVWIGYDVQVSSGSSNKNKDSSGLDIPEWKNSLGGSADQMQIEVGYFPAPRLAQDHPQSLIGSTPWPRALQLGMFDNAKFTMYTAWWADPVSMLNGTPPIGYGETGFDGKPFSGLVNIFSGFVSAVSDIGRSKAQLSIRDGRMLFDTDYPRDVFQKTCLHTLFDAGCTLVESSFMVSGTFPVGATQLSFAWTSGQAADYYSLGKLKYTDALLGNIVLGIQYDSGTQITLQQPFPSIPPSGTAFTITPGCRKTNAICNSKFSNLVHFLGFPFVPAARISI